MYKKRNAKYEEERGTKVKLKTKKREKQNKTKRGAFIYLRRALITAFFC